MTISTDAAALQKLAAENAALRADVVQLRADQTALINALVDALRHSAAALSPADLRERMNRWEALPEHLRRPSLQFLAAYDPNAFDAMLNTTASLAGGGEDGSVRQVHEKAEEHLPWSLSSSLPSSLAT